MWGGKGGPVVEDGGLSDLSSSERAAPPPLLLNERGDEGLLLRIRGAPGGKSPPPLGDNSSADLFKSDGKGGRCCLAWAAAKGEVSRWCSALVRSELACSII